MYTRRPSPCTFSMLTIGKLINYKTRKHTLHRIQAGVSNVKEILFSNAVIIILPDDNCDKKLSRRTIIPKKFDGYMDEK